MRRRDGYLSLNWHVIFSEEATVDLTYDRLAFQAVKDGMLPGPSSELPCLRATVGATPLGRGKSKMRNMGTVAICTALVGCAS